MLDLLPEFIFQQISDYLDLLDIIRLSETNSKICQSSFWRHVLCRYNFILTSTSVKDSLRDNFLYLLSEYQNMLKRYNLKEDKKYWIIQMTEPVYLDLIKLYPLDELIRKRTELEFRKDVEEFRRLLLETTGTMSTYLVIDAGPEYKFKDSDNDATIIRVINLFCQRIQDYLLVYGNYNKHADHQILYQNLSEIVEHIQTFEDYRHYHSELVRLYDDLL